MERLYISALSGSDETLILNREQTKYLRKVLRMAIGDRLLAFDGEKCEYLAELIETENGAGLKIHECVREEAPYVPKITLAQALPKQGKAETIIQKCTELGVHAIQPFVSRYSVSRPNAKQQEGKQERWRKVAQEAARQCGRISVPDVRPIALFDEAIRNAEGWLAFAHEGDGSKPLKDLLSQEKPDAFTIFIGPEGGFSPEEIADAKARNAALVGLGPRILRTETAGPALLAIAQYVWGDMASVMPKPY